MALNIAFTEIANNVGMRFENIILLLVIAGGLIFYAGDVKLGLLMQFLGTGLLFIWFYSAGLYYVPSLVVFLITVVILSLSLYASAKSSQGFIA